MKRVRRMVAALAAAARNENLRRAELAWGAAIAAEWGHFVALGVFAYEEGGATAVGIAGLVRLLPSAFVAPFAASFADRFPRERFLLAVTLVGAGALAASAAAAYSGGVIAVFVLAAVVGLSSTLFRPALTALLPSVARTPEELIASNGATSTIESLGTLLGPLLAGTLLAVAGVGFVFGVGAAVLLAAAALLARVRVDTHITKDGLREGGIRRMVGGGFRALALARAPRIRLIVALAAAQTFVRGCLNVLIVVVVFDVFRGGAAQVGYLTAAIGVGGLIGALWSMTLHGRRLAVQFGVALMFWGTPLMLIAPRPDLIGAVILLAIVGAANSIEDVVVITLLQRIVPHDMLGRFFGLFWGLAMGGVAIGSIAAAPIANVLGPRAAFVVVGAILPCLALLGYRGLVELDRTVMPAAELSLIERVPMFAPLSVAAKERIASNLVPLSVSAGDVVIRTGDSGDRFYIVGEGEFHVDQGTRHATAHDGDYFGEIALLRDVPRTATVTAATDSHLFALQRDDFLAAVTGHSAAFAAGNAVADARLAAPSPTRGAPHE